MSERSVRAVAALASVAAAQSPQARARTDHPTNDLSDAEAHYLKSKLSHCWRSSYGQPHPERLRIVVHIELEKDGALKIPPKIASPASISTDHRMLQGAAKNALAAVRVCASSDGLKPERYVNWRAFDLSFGGDIQ